MTARHAGFQQQNFELGNLQLMRTEAEDGARGSFMKIERREMDQLRREHNYGEVLVPRASMDFDGVLDDAITAYGRAVVELESHGLTALEKTGLNCDFTIPEQPSGQGEHVNRMINIEMFTGRVLDSGVVRALVTCLPSDRVGFYLTMHHKFVAGGIEIALSKEQCLIASRSGETESFVLEMMTEMLAIQAAE